MEHRINKKSGKLTSYKKISLCLEIETYQKLLRIMEYKSFGSIHETIRQITKTYHDTH
jgi:hypothetical protein